MSEGANGFLRRVSIGSESSTLYSAPGSFTHVRGVEGLTHQGPRESLADNRHLTSRKGQYASRLGVKSVDVGFQVPVHSAIQTDLDAAFTAALGTKSANTLTWSADISTGSGITKSAGTFDPLVMGTVGGVTFVRPGKTIATNDLTMAIKFPGATTTAKQAITGGGACYVQDPTAAFTAMQIQCDASGEADYVPATYKGCVPDRLALSLDLAQQLMFDLHFVGGDWTKNSAPDITNPSALSGQLIGQQAECFLQDIGTPLVGTQIDLHSMEINLCWEWIPRTAARANTSGVIPGSPLSGWKQGLFCPDGLKITVTKQNNNYVAARTNKTPYGFFMCWSLGAPGDTATSSKMALWIPRVVLDADPVEVDIDGISGYELQFKVEEESSLSAGVACQAALAFFL